jgi:hypothetical protein
LKINVESELGSSPNAACFTNKLKAELPVVSTEADQDRSINRTSDLGFAQVENCTEDVSKGLSDDQMREILNAEYTYQVNGEQ